MVKIDTLYISGADDNLEMEMALPNIYNAGYSFNYWNLILPQKTPLETLLKNMIYNNYLPDSQIYIGNKIFQCHSMVFLCYSEYFNELTNLKLIHLPEDKVTQEAFVKIYLWMLCDNPIIEKEGIMQLFVAARFLKINELIHHCWLTFNDSGCLTEDASFRMSLKANEAGQLDLEQKLLARICKFFMTAVASNDFLDLSKTQVCSLLSSSGIGVHSEVEVLLAAVRWLKHDWDKREQFVEDITKCVRFNLMPSCYLVALTKHDVAPDVLQVIKHPEVNRMIIDGLLVCTSQIFFTHNEKDFQEFVKRMELPLYPERVWIYDTQCDYAILHCSNKINIASCTYDAFNNYLSKIRNLGKEHWTTVQLTRDASDSG